MIFQKFRKNEKSYPYLFDFSCRDNVVGAWDDFGESIEWTSRRHFFDLMGFNVSKWLGLYHEVTFFAKITKTLLCTVRSNNRVPYCKNDGFSWFSEKYRNHILIFFDFSCRGNVVGARNDFGDHVEWTSRSHFFDSRFLNVSKWLGLYHEVRVFTKITKNPPLHSAQ